MENIFLKKAYILFPRVSDKKENYEKIINLNIKDNLKTEDQEWAKKFITEVTLKPNFIEIKKAFSTLALSDFIKYHTFYESILDDENIIDMLNSSQEKIVKYNQLCCKVIDLGLLKQEPEKFKESCAIIEEDLEKEDSKIHHHLIIYIESLLSFTDKEQIIHKQMILNSKKELYDRLNFTKNNVNRKLAKTNEREIISHIQTTNYKTDKRKNLRMF